VQAAEGWRAAHATWKGNPGQQPYSNPRNACAGAPVQAAEGWPAARATWKGNPGQQPYSNPRNACAGAPVQAAEGWRALAACVRMNAFIVHPGIGGALPRSPLRSQALSTPARQEWLALVAR